MDRFCAVFVIAVAACALTAAPAAFAVSVGDYFAEAGIGALCGYAALGGGLGIYVLGDLNTDYDDPANGPMVMGGVIIAAYPALTALGVYAMGEAVDGPSANKLASWGIPTVAAYGASGIFWAGSIAIGYGNFGLAVDAVTKPFLTAWIYNIVKEPAPAAVETSRGPTLQPYVATAVGEEGRPVPLYGLTFSF